MGQAASTIAELSQRIGQNPNDARSLAHRGEIYQSTGCYAEALADLDRAIELNADYTWAIARRGETFCLLQQYEQALADFDRALALNSNYLWALAHRAVVYRWQGRCAEALTDLCRVIELKPDYGWALVHRGNIYIGLRRYQEALIDFERVATIDSTIVDHWNGEYGLLLNYVGQYAKTITICAHELHAYPDDHIAFYSLVVAQVFASGLAQTQLNMARLLELLQNKLQYNTDKKLQAGILYRLGGLNALQRANMQALDYLQAAILLDNEPKEIARHDPAWTDLRGDTNFRTIIRD